MVASEEGHTEIVALLLKTKGIDVNEGVSDISSIVAHCFLHYYLLLTSNRLWLYVCAYSSHQQSPLTAASYHGHIEVVDMLLQVKGIDVNKLVRIMISIPTIYYNTSSHNTDVYWNDLYCSCDIYHYHLHPFSILYFDVYFIAWE